MDLQNEREWANPDNWAGPAGCRCYFSKRDSRLWVPKSNPRLGWTVNFGHKYGFLTMMFLMMVPVFGLLAAVILGHLCKAHGL